MFRFAQLICILFMAPIACLGVLAKINKLLDLLDHKRNRSW
jgi:hypothetical protein